MKKMKASLAWLFLVVMLITIAGCSEKEGGVISNSSKPAETISEDTTEPTKEEIERKQEFANSTPENDTDVGLKNIKIDTAEWTLTDEQKAVIQYFDSDYFDYNDYEFLRRYPQVFDGTQIAIYGGTVKKTLSQDSTEYSLILQIGIETEDTKEYVVINGKTGKTLFIEGDQLYLNGRYQGVETIEVDGVSYTVPVISVFNAYFVGDAKFDAANVKK